MGIKKVAVSLAPLQCELSHVCEVPDFPGHEHIRQNFLLSGILVTLLSFNRLYARLKGMQLTRKAAIDQLHVMSIF